MLIAPFLLPMLGGFASGVGQGLMSRATQNKTGFSPQDASARMSFFNQNVEPGMEEQQNAWYTRQGNAANDVLGLYNYFLSDIASGSGGLPDFSMLDRAGRELLNRSGGIYDPFREAIDTGRDTVGTAENYLSMAGNFGLAPQQMQRRQLDEQLARLGPGLGPAQAAQIKNRLIQQNNLSAAASRENIYSDAVKQLLATKSNLAGLQGNLGGAYLTGATEGGRLGANRAGIHESALNRQQASKMVLPSLLAQKANIDLMTNPITNRKWDIAGQIATGQPLTQPQTNYGQLAAGAGFDALSTYMKQRQAGGETPQWTRGYGNPQK